MSELPDRIGDYEIEGELGAGGMAKVYRARHVILDTVHAIKVLDPSYRANPDARKRFLDEAKIQAKHLDHPNIVKVTNIVATAEHAALVMELVVGPSLEAKAADLKQRPDEIKRIMLGVLAGVGHAHQAGIIHRDLKPANVLLQQRGGELIAKVTDFGIAKVSAALAGTSKKSTRGDSRMGTLAYMSPEQIRRAKDVTPRSDIFSLGVLLYELATGVVPFDGDSDYDLMENIVNGRYQPPERRYQGIDPVLASVIHKALEADPARRFASCEEMAAALRGDVQVPALVASTAPAAVATSAPAPAANTGRRGRTGVIIGLVAAGVALGGAAVIVATRGHGRTGAGGGQGAVASSIDAGGSAAVDAAIDARPVDAAIAIDARPVDAAIAIDARPLDAAIAVDARPLDAAVVPIAPVDAGAAPPPVENPCRGRWTSGDDMTVTITARTSGACGTYAFYDRDSGVPVRTCGGSITGCRLDGATLTGSYSCTYDKYPPQPLSGTMRMTCTGRRMTNQTSQRTWDLRR